MIIISKHYSIDMSYIKYWRSSNGGKGTTLTFKDDKSVYITCEFDVFNDQYRTAKIDNLKVYWLEY